MPQSSSFLWVLSSFAQNSELSYAFLDTLSESTSFLLILILTSCSLHLACIRTQERLKTASYMKYFMLLINLYRAHTSTLPCVTTVLACSLHLLLQRIRKASPLLSWSLQYTRSYIKHSEIVLNVVLLLFIINTLLFNHILIDMKRHTHIFCPHTTQLPPSIAAS